MLRFGLGWKYGPFRPEDECGMAILSLEEGAFQARSGFWTVTLGLVIIVSDFRGMRFLFSALKEPF
jgi:hypothetical protein